MADCVSDYHFSLAEIDKQTQTNKQEPNKQIEAQLIVDMLIL